LDPVGAPGADGVVAGVDLGEEPWNLLGRVLEVGVERDDDVRARVRESGEDRRMLPDVPGERDDRDALVPGGDREQDVERPVAAAVVDVDHLGGPIERLADGAQAGLERGKPRGLVEYRDDDRDRGRL